MIRARLKYILTSQKGKVPKTFSDDNSFPPYLSMDYLRGENGNVLYVKHKEEYKFIDENEVLVLWDGANAGEVMLSKKGFLSSTMAIVTPKSEFFEKRFLFYFLKSIEGELKKASTGTTIPHLDQNFLFNTHFEFPEIEVQKPIADYLDEQSNKISRLIQTKQRFIELLKEQRQSIITQAVTKGIDDGAKMKETGVDWLGKIPELWKERRLRYLCKITTGKKNTEDRIENGEYPFFVRSQTVERINSYSFDGEGILTAGDGVGVGKVFHYINGRFDFHQRVYLFYNFDVDIEAEFLFHYLQSNLMSELMRYNAKSTVDSIRLPVLKDFLVVFPNRAEQKSIVEHIKSETRSIDIAISKAEREIELIKEYREAMIAEAVIGKSKL